MKLLPLLLLQQLTVLTLLSYTASLELSFSTTTRATISGNRTVSGTSDPEIRFGNFFYVAFPGDLLSQFFGCLCNTSTLQCSVSYELLDQQTSTVGFPYLYRVLRNHQTTILPTHSHLYRAEYICDVLNYVPGDDITCYRQRHSDPWCEPVDKCQEYSANFTDAACGLACWSMSWLSAFTVPITFHNLGGDVNLTENGVCPNSSVSRLGNTTTDAGSDNVLIFPVAASIGALVFGSVTLGLVCYCLRRKRRSKGAEHSTNYGSSVEKELQVSANLALDSATSNNKNNRNQTANQSNDTEYLEIDTMAECAANQVRDGDCDAEGYNIICDENSIGTNPERQWENPNNRLELFRNGQDSPMGQTSSPPPLPPRYGDCLSPSTSSSDTTTPSSDISSPPSFESAQRDGLSTPAAAHRPGAKDVTPPASASLPTPHAVKNSQTSVHFNSTAPNPPPHKFPVKTKNHQYLGLVNLQRGAQPAENEPSQQMKLVSSQRGDLELVTLHENLPAFTQYSSKIQLIGLQNGTLAVVGLLDAPPDGEYHDDDYDYFKLLKVHNHPNLDKTETGPKATNHLHKESAGEAASKLYLKGPNCSSSVPLLHYIYFGTVDIEDSYRVRPAKDNDYLTVLDVDPGIIPAKTGDYLTVLDLDTKATN